MPQETQLDRRAFIGTLATTALAATAISPQVVRAEVAAPEFGRHRIYYDNFAAHLLNAYNPNVYYPELAYRWSDADWFGLIDMIAAFGFNTFQYWIEPQFFCREGLESKTGREFARQMNAVIGHAHTKNVKVHGILAIATVGRDWLTLCPNEPEAWAEVRRLWDAWTKRLPEQDTWGIFPGDPGACSRNGCTAITYIDRSLEIAQLVRQNCPKASIEMNAWGPPFFGWGIIKGPSDWKGEFVQSFQGTAWTFDKRRADESMAHLVKRLPEFPPGTMVSQNLGFNPDGNPSGEQDSRNWVKEIAKTNDVLTWDFSLTEGENAIAPHGRFRRLFGRRKEERAVGAYSGGICFTMTPLLNQCSHYCSAQSFLRPDADPLAVAGEFFAKLYGAEGAKLAPYLPLFEIVGDWGCHVQVLQSRDEFHRRMLEFNTILGDLRPRLNEAISFHPQPAVWHEELAFFGKLFADGTAASPDFDELKKRYWNRVYAIYDKLPNHVDPRPHGATNNLIDRMAPDRWPKHAASADANEWTRG